MKHTVNDSDEPPSSPYNLRALWWPFVALIFLILLMAKSGYLALPSW